MAKHTLKILRCEHRKAHLTVKSNDKLIMNQLTTFNMMRKSVLYWSNLQVVHCGETFPRNFSEKLGWFLGLGPADAMFSMSYYHQHKNYLWSELLRQEHSDPVGSYMVNVNIRSTRARCEICSKLTIKTPEQRHWRCSCVFIVNFEYISHLVLVFRLLTLSR